VQVFPLAMQTQTSGGPSVGDGMAQAGAAVEARADFLAALTSHITEPFTSVALGTVSSPSGRSILGGAGTWRGIEIPGVAAGVVIVTSAPTNGRFNTSANIAGRYGETWTNSVIELTDNYTAFGMYYMDLGDFGGELEIEFFAGDTLTRTITAPTADSAAKAGAGEASFITYVNGSQPFNRVVLKVRQFVFDQDFVDYVGYDDITVGQYTGCAPVAAPVVHYGINTVATTAKTVAGPAKTARDAWAAAAGTFATFDFEEQAVVVPAAGGTLSGPGPGIVQYQCRNHRTDFFVTNEWDLTPIVSAIANSGASARWNTTSGGGKWLEWTDELILRLDGDYRKIGFYVTDLGNQNATLRITLRRNPVGFFGTGPAFVHYMPKAAELNSPDGLLRFWGVIGEQPFNEVVLQVVYYNNLTPGTYSYLPAWVTGGPIETVGIDDILIGT